MTRIIQWKEQNIAIREVKDEPGQAEPVGECDQSYGFVYAGHGTTNSGGLWTIDLSAINCIPPGPRHDSLPSFVATPAYNGLLDVLPDAVILVASVIPGGKRVEVRSFLHDGTSIGRVRFSWHCVIEGELVTKE